MRFDQNQPPAFKIRHCTAQKCNVRSSTSTNKKIEKNTGPIGGKGSDVRSDQGDAGANNLANRRQVSGFSGMVLCIGQTKSAASKRRRAQIRLRTNELLTLAISTVSTKIAATGMLELTVTLRADADHVRHDHTGDRRLYLRLGLVFTNRTG